MFAEVFKTFLFLTSVTSWVSAIPYDGFKVYEVKSRNSNALDALETLSKNNGSFYEFFRLPTQERSSRLIVHPEGIQNFLDLVSKHSMEFRLLDENFGATIDRDIKLHHQLKESSPFRAGERLGTERYYTLDEIHSYMEDLKKRYPKRVFVKTIGKSFERRSLKTITITNGDGRVGKKVILIDGGIHAFEWFSPASAVYIIGELVENFNDYSDLLSDYDWIIFPVVNADGYEYTQISSDTRLWRKTRKPYYDIKNDKHCFGADINRNFGIHWSELGTSEFPCDEVYGGPKAFSEPEAIVLRDLLLTLRDRAVMYITLHSFGGLILYPWRYDLLLPENWKELHEVGLAGVDAINAATGYTYNLGSAAITFLAASGASDDYAYSVGIPQVFTIKLNDTGGSGFYPPAKKN